MRWIRILIGAFAGLTYVEASLFDHEEALGLACGMAAQELFDSCNQEDYACFCEDPLYVFSVQKCIGREAHFNSTIMGRAYDKFTYKFCELHGIPVVVSDVWSSENQAKNPEVTKKAFKLAYEGERNNMSQKSISVWLGIGMILYWAFLIVVVTVVEWIRMFVLRLVQYRVVMKRPSSAERWLQKWVLIPALFGTRHMRRLEYLRGWVIFSVPTRLETLVVAGYTLLAFIFMLTPYTFMNNDPLYGTRWREMMRYSSDRAGIIATTQIPLMALFAMRNNVFIWISGWSYSTFNTYHRAVSRITYLLLVIHAILKHIFSASYGGSLSKYYYPVPYFRWGCAAIGLLSLMIIVAMLRSRAYEVGYRLHQAMALASVICSHYHLNGLGFKEPLWIFFAIWGLDWLIRVFRILLFNVNVVLPPLPGARKTTFATMRLYDGHMVKVSITTPVRWNCYAGQYVFLHMSQYSFIGGHPFSVVGPTEHGEGLELIIKARSGMTRQLCASLAKRGCSPEYPITVPAYVEGPYGNSVPVERYEEGLFFAGGIGITGVLGYMDKMIESNNRRETCKKVKLFWAIRMKSDVAPVLHRLAQLLRMEEVEIYLFLRSPGVCDKPEGYEVKSDINHEVVTLDTDLSSSDIRSAEYVSQGGIILNMPRDSGDSSSTRMVSFDPHPHRDVNDDGARRLHKDQVESIRDGKSYDTDTKSTSHHRSRSSSFSNEKRKSSLPRHQRTRSELKQIRRSVVKFAKSRDPETEDDLQQDYGREEFMERGQANIDLDSASGDLNEETARIKLNPWDRPKMETDSEYLERHRDATFINAGFTDRIERRMTMLNPFDDNVYPYGEPSQSMMELPVDESKEIEDLIYNQIKPVRMDIVSIIRQRFLRADGSVCVVGCGPDRMVDTLAWATGQFLDLAEYGRVDYFEASFRW